MTDGAQKWNTRRARSRLKTGVAALSQFGGLALPQGFAASSQIGFVDSADQLDAMDDQLGRMESFESYIHGQNKQPVQDTQ